MSNNIGYQPSPYYITPNNTGYQYNTHYKGDSGNFTSSSGDTAFTNVASDATGGLMDNPVALVASLLSGFGLSFIADRIVRSAVKRKGDKSYFARTLNRIDNSFIVNNRLYRKTSKFLIGASDWVSKKRINFAKKHTKIHDNFGAGYRRKTMLAQSPLEYKLTKEFNEKVKKCLGGKVSPKALAELTPHEMKNEFGKEIPHYKFSSIEEVEGKIKELKLSNGKEILDELKNNKKVMLPADKMKVLKNSKSGLSKGMSKSVIGLNNIFGGKFGWIINGLFLGMSINSSVNAQKGNKLNSFVEDMLKNYLGGFVLLILTARGVNGVANVLTNVSKTGLLGKIARGAGKTLNWGHGVEFIKKGKTFGGYMCEKLLKKPNSGINGKWFGPGLFGGIIRIAVASFLTSQIFGNNLVRMYHGILNLLHIKYIDQEKEDKLKKQQEKQREKQQEKLKEQQQLANMNAQRINQQSPGNKSNLGQHSLGQSNNNYVPPIRTDSSQTTPVRSYMPSPDPDPDIFKTKSKVQNDPQVNSLLSQSDAVIDSAQNTLSGNKNNYYALNNPYQYQ